MPVNAKQAISRLRDVVRRQHKAISTESTYVFWLRRDMLAIPRYPEAVSSEQKLERPELKAIVSTTITTPKRPMTIREHRSTAFPPMTSWK